MVLCKSLMLKCKENVCFCLNQQARKSIFWFLLKCQCWFVSFDLNIRGCGFCILIREQLLGGLVVVCCFGVLFPVI